MTANTPVRVKGIMLIDGRDHDPSGTLLNTTTGKYGIWSSSDISQIGGAKIGGTADGINYPPSSPADSVVILPGQVYPGGFPTSPDSVLGGSLNGFPEGTLKSIAQDNWYLSQYITDIATLQPLLSGVTYLELSDTLDHIIGSNIGGSGILVVHNTSNNAKLTLMKGSFSGIIIADNLYLEGTIQVCGAIILIGAVTSPYQLGAPGTAAALYSYSAVNNSLNAILPSLRFCGGTGVHPAVLPHGQTGIAYNVNVTVVGSNAPYSFQSFDLPTWLSLSPQGTLSGIPPTVEKDSFLVHVTDSTGCSFTAGYSLTVDSQSHVSGHLYWDANANGVNDPGENALQGWSVKLYGTTDDSSMTNISGNYSFNGMPDGNYLLAEKFRSGWTQNYPHGMQISVDTFRLAAQMQVFKHLASIAQNAYSYRITPRIQGGGSGSYFGYIVPADLRSDAYGSYTITYQGSRIIRFQGGGNTLSISCDSNGIITSITGLSQTLWYVGIGPNHRNTGGLDFGNVPYEIRGKVFADYEDAKPGLAGWRVELHGPIDTFAITDVNGNYVFRNIPWGTYTLKENVSDGWTQTIPPAKQNAIDTDASQTMSVINHLCDLVHDAWKYNVTPVSLGGGGGSYTGYTVPFDLQSDSVATYGLGTVAPTELTIVANHRTYPWRVTIAADDTGRASLIFDGGWITAAPPGSYLFFINSVMDEYGQSATTANFGNVQSALIRGTVFHDVNNNGVQDQDEHGFSGWRVYAGGSVTDSVITDSSGNYQFSNLPAGKYYINESVETDWIQTTPPASVSYAMRDSVARDLDSALARLNLIAGHAVRWKQISTTVGGGGGQFLGYVLPAPLAIRDPIGQPTTSIAHLDFVTGDSIRATSSSLSQFGEVSATLDTLGKFHNVVMTGDFANLGSRCVNSDSSKLLVDHVTFGNSILFDTIFVSSHGNGTALPSGTIVIGPGRDTSIFFSPNVGYHVDSVLVDGRRIDSLARYTMKNVGTNHTIAVYFSINMYSITVTIAGNGRVTPAGSLHIPYGGIGRVVITPDTGSHVDSVMVDGGVVDSIYGFTFSNVDNDHTLRIVFKLFTYTITAVAGPHGKILPLGTATVNYGTDQLYTMLPDSDYAVDSVLVDNFYIGYPPSYTFTRISNNHQITVTFKNNVTTAQRVNAPGWNLLSVPVLTKDTRREILFPRAISDPFAYLDGYVVEDSLMKGVGYWLKFLSDDTVQLTGITITAETIAVHTGWNLIGSMTRPMPVSSVSSDSAGVQTGPYYGFNGSYFVADTLLPGYGYWVRVNKPTSLILRANYSQIQSGVKIVLTGERPPLPPGHNTPEVNVLPRLYSLKQNYPNPFNPITLIEYDLPKTGYVRIVVYDVLGRNVAPLVDGVQAAGYRTVGFDGTALPSGIYFYRIQADGYTDVKKMALIR